MTKNNPTPDTEKETVDAGIDPCPRPEQHENNAMNGKKSRWGARGCICRFQQPQQKL